MAIRVLIVDDSPIMQRLLAATIDGEDDLKIAGVARDPFEARDMIKVLKPDVITLDVEMPRMDGITFLEKLMRLRPMPVVMVSSLTESDAGITLRALELGAVDFVTKPKGNARAGFAEFGVELCEKLRASVSARLKRPHAIPPPPGAAPVSFQPLGLIAIGASTGGTEALKEVLARLPSNSPPVVIVQHMPEMFTRMFAGSLNSICALKVTEAVNGESLLPGHAYIAPGNWHVSIKRVGRHLQFRTTQEDPVNRHRPSVDVLFHSVAGQVGQHAVGALLTGMGRDGADGMGALKRAGAFTIAQDRDTCVVFGMPKVAIDAGHVTCVAPLEDIAGHILN
ncbi:MAG: chemotaxis response regulator protein-glutamate methylesterase, partial [Betaproteobacteria bacterium]